MNAFFCLFRIKSEVVYLILTLLYFIDYKCITLSIINMLYNRF